MEKFLEFLIMLSIIAFIFSIAIYITVSAIQIFKEIKEN